MSTIVLDGNSLTIEQVVRIAREGVKVELAPEARAEIVKKRAYIEENWLTENAPATERRLTCQRLGSWSRLPKKRRYLCSLTL